MRIVAPTLLALAIASMSPHAHAQDALAAEALFAEGRKLMKEARYTEACLKLEASLSLDRATGTIFNLADCYERLGRTASAWVHFREVAALSRQAGQVERERVAREHADLLEASLCRLTVRFVARDGLVVMRDQKAVVSSQSGVAIPVDPGVHTVAARQPGYSHWLTRVTLTPLKGKSCDQVLVVPPMVPLLDTPETSPPKFFGTRRVLSIASAGLGVGAFTTGTILALSAKSQYDAAKAKCNPGCPPDAAQDSIAAGNRADVATGFFVGGGVFAALGVVLWFTSPSSSGTVRVTPHVTPTSAGTSANIVF